MSQKPTSLKERLLAIKKKVVEDASKKSYESDPRFWKPKFDNESKSAAAIIRILPMSVDEQDTPPWVVVFSHQFKNEATKKFYDENSRSTLGEEDPVNNYALDLWAQWKKTQSKADKDEAKKYTRKKNWIANILVVQDPAVPENEGKVFLWKFGPYLEGLIQSAMFPEDDEDAINTNPLLADEDSRDPFIPWDLDEGADLKLVLSIPKGKAIPTYESSKFLKNSPISLGGKKLTEKARAALFEAGTLHDLSSLIEESNFKSYDELEKKMNDVIYGKKTKTAEELSSSKEAEVTVTKSASPKKVTAKPVAPAVVEEDDDLETDEKEFDELFNDITLE